MQAGVEDLHEYKWLLQGSSTLSFKYKYNIATRSLLHFFLQLQALLFQPLGFWRVIFLFLKYTPHYALPSHCHQSSCKSSRNADTINMPGQEELLKRKHILLKIISCFCSVHLYWVFATSLVSIKKKKNQRTLKFHSSVRLLWNDPTERWAFIDKLLHLNIVLLWHEDEHTQCLSCCHFTSCPWLPPWAEGTSSDGSLVSLKYPTWACVASWDTAQEQLPPGSFTSGWTGQGTRQAHSGMEGPLTLASLGHGI